MKENAFSIFLRRPVQRKYAAEAAHGPCAGGLCPIVPQKEDARHKEDHQDMREKRKNLICRLVEEEYYVPMKEKEIALFMQVDSSDRQELKEILDELVREGRLALTKRGKYMKGDGKPSELVGTFISNA